MNHPNKKEVNANIKNILIFENPKTFKVNKIFIISYF